MSLALAPKAPTTGVPTTEEVNELVSWVKTVCEAIKANKGTYQTAEDFQAAYDAYGAIQQELSAMLKRMAELEVPVAA